MVRVAGRFFWSVQEEKVLSRGEVERYQPTNAAFSSEAVYKTEEMLSHTK